MQALWQCGPFLLNDVTKKLLSNQRVVGSPSLKIKHRNLWSWLNSIFNRVDESRIAEVGPDRACAEWLLRCGASVKWLNSEGWIKDYNSLPLTGMRQNKIEEVNATESSVMHIGFPYFRRCEHIRRIVFHKASYLDDESLRQLFFLKKSLNELQISSCGNISSEGLSSLIRLSNLEHLLLYDLPLIRDKNVIESNLKNSLPNCKVDFPFAQDSERDDKAR